MDNSDLVRPGLTTKCLKDLPEIKKKLRAKVPILNTNDIRRAKQPIAEVIIIELLEDGFPSSAKFIHKLLAIEEHFPTTLIAKKLLKHSTDVLDELSEILKPSENSTRNKNFEQSFSTIIDGCLKLIETLHVDQIWIVEHFFTLAHEHLLEWNPESKMFTARYHNELGRYYYGQLKDYPRSMQQFTEAFELCSTGGSESQEWTISETNFHKLFTPVLFGYIKSLRESAVHYSNTNYTLAFEYAKLFIELIEKNELATEEGELSDCYRVYGDLLMMAKGSKDAVEVYQKGLDFAYCSTDLQRMCEGYYKLVVVNLELGNIEECDKNLKFLKKYASMNHDFDHYMAKYYDLKGQIFLRNGLGMKAADEFGIASDIYHQTGMLDDSKKMHILAAYAFSEDLMKLYTESLTRIDNKENDEIELDKLLLWKIRRTPFWVSSSTSNETQGNYLNEIRKQIFDIRDGLNLDEIEARASTAIRKSRLSIRSSIIRKSMVQK